MTAVHGRIPPVTQRINDIQTVAVEFMIASGSNPPPPQALPKLAKKHSITADCGELKATFGPRLRLQSSRSNIQLRFVAMTICL